MNNKGRTHYTFGDVMIWLIIFVAGSLIVTFILSPSSFYNFKSNIKEIIPPTSSNSNVNPSSNSEVQDPSLISCSEEVNKKRYLYEEKSFFPVDIYVKEYKKFSNTPDALNYVTEWIASPYLLDMQYSELKEDVEYGDIIVFLIKSEANFQGQQVQIIRPLVCINGELTQKSKEIRLDI